MSHIVYMLNGLSGSGKSSWAGRFMLRGNHNKVIVERDNIRLAMSDYSHTPEAEIKVHEATVAEVLRQISLHDVIIDETTIFKRFREDWIKVLRHADPDIHIICVKFTETERNLANRMSGDTRGHNEGYWAMVLDNMKCSYDPPTLDEGFDEIWEVAPIDVMCGGYKIVQHKFRSRYENLY